MKNTDKGFVDSWGVAHDHRGETIYGWFSKQNILWYRNKIKTIKNGKIVEVGIFGGLSILSVIDICNINKNIIYGIDPWEKISNFNGEALSDKKKLEQMQKKMKIIRKNLEKIVKKFSYTNIHLIHDFASSAVKSFYDKELDMIFIDGNHGYDFVSEDLNLWYPKNLKKVLIHK